MHLRIRQVHIEGLALLRGAGHEIAGPLGDLAVKAGPEPGVVVRDRLGFPASFPRVDGLWSERNLHVAGVGGRGDGARGEVGLHRPEDLISGARAPHRLIEPEVDGAAVLRVAAQVPLAPHAGRVARLRQRLRDRHLPARQSVGAARDRYRRGARPQRVPAGQQRRAARRALGLDIEVQQAQALSGEPVDPGRRRAAQHTTAVAAHLAPAQVVPEEEHDVRLLSSWHVTPLLRLRSRTPGLGSTSMSGRRFDHEMGDSTSDRVSYDHADHLAANPVSTAGAVPDRRRRSLCCSHLPRS